MISVGVRLAAFNLEELASLTRYDEMELEQIGERKTALFAIIPDNDSTFNFVIGMLYTQLFQMLYYQADFVHGKNVFLWERVYTEIQKWLRYDPHIVITFYRS